MHPARMANSVQVPLWKAWSTAAHFLNGPWTSAGFRLTAKSKFQSSPMAGLIDRRIRLPPPADSLMAFRARSGAIDQPVNRDGGSEAHPVAKSAECRSGMDISGHFVKVAGRRIAFREMVRASSGIPDRDPAKIAVQDRSHPCRPDCGSCVEREKGRQDFRCPVS